MMKPKQKKINTEANAKLDRNVGIARSSRSPIPR